MSLKEIFKTTEGSEYERLVDRNGKIKKHLLPLFNGLSKTEVEITIQTLKEGLDENMKITL